jgi:hypothetical protein
MSHPVSIICICHTVNTPGPSAKNYDVLEKASYYEVRNWLKLIFGKSNQISPPAGRATTSYLSKATLGAQAIAIVSKM